MIFDMLYLSTFGTQFLKFLHWKTLRENIRNHILCWTVTSFDDFTSLLLLLLHTVFNESFFCVHVFGMRCHSLASDTYLTHSDYLRTLNAFILLPICLFEHLYLLIYHLSSLLFFNIHRTSRTTQLSFLRQLTESFPLLPRPDVRVPDAIYEQIFLFVFCCILLLFLYTHLVRILSVLGPYFTYRPWKCTRRLRSTICPRDCLCMTFVQLDEPTSITSNKTCRTGINN